MPPILSRIASRVEQPFLTSKVWVPLEYEFDKVVIAENEKASSVPHPALSRRLLDFVYHSRKAEEPLTLDRIIDEFANDNPEEHRAFLAQMKAAMARNVAVWQRLTPDEMEHQLPVLYHAGPTLHLAARIVRALVKEGKSHQWTPNDAFDFSHALVPLVYADAVFLDKQWKKRIGRLQLEGPFAKVFYGYEASTFLDWFERFEERSEPE